MKKRMNKCNEFISLIKKSFKSLGFRSLTGKELRYFIPAVFCFAVLLIFLSGKTMISSMFGSVYNISSLRDNIDDINAGDIVNYEVNGYSDWKILSIDKENGTIEVTSNTNVKDLTIEPYKSVDEYNKLFQSEADKFKDDNYVVSTRTINKADTLLLGDVEEEFWLANVNELSLMTNKSNSDSESIVYTNTSIPLNDFYVIPFITIKSPLGNMIPNVGEVINFSSNGIDQWFYSGQTMQDNQYGEVLVYLPITPVQLYVRDLDNIGSVSQSYFSSFNTTGIIGYGNWLDKFSHNFSDVINLYRGKNVFDNEKKVMYFVAETGRKTTSEDGKYNIMKSYGDKPGVRHYYDSAANGCYEHWENNDYVYCDSYYYLDESEIFMYDTTDQNSANGSKDRSVYYVPKTLSFGYRPVLTLRIDNDGSNNDNNSNENNIEDNRHQINNELEIGNYVKYDANGYKNWRVLSVDVSAGTVDVISGGIVKNLSLYGKDDYENYEDILQREVDVYKIGNRAISARAVQESDVDMLNNIGDSVGGMYWFNRKTQPRLDLSQNIQTGVIYNEYSYDVGVLSSNNYFEDDTTEGIKKYWVKLYVNPENRSKSEKTYDENHQYDGYYETIENDTGIGNMNYIAGLRPIITLSLKDIEMLSGEEVTDVINQSNASNQSYVDQQVSSNNSGYLSPVRKYSSGTGSNYGGSSGGSYSGSGSSYGSYYNGDYSKGDLVNSSNSSRKALLNFGKTNFLLGWIVLITFLYGIVFAVAIMGIIIYLIKKAYTK